MKLRLYLVARRLLPPGDGEQAVRYLAASARSLDETSVRRSAGKTGVSNSSRNPDAGGAIEGNQPAVESVCGWDSQDWVELMLWSEELPAQLATVGDVLKLLEEIGTRYPEP